MLAGWEQSKESGGHDLSQPPLSSVKEMNHDHIGNRMLSHPSRILHEFRQMSNIPEAFLSHSIASNKTAGTPKRAALKAVTQLCHALANSRSWHIFGWEWNKEEEGEVLVAFEQGHVT